MLSILFIYFNHYHDSETLAFIYFVGLKIHWKLLVYAAHCRVPSWTLQNKSRLSKVILPAKDTWLRAKKPSLTTCTKVNMNSKASRRIEGKEIQTPLSVHLYKYNSLVKLGDSNSMYQIRELLLRKSWERH